MKAWNDADRISDRIVELINEEVKRKTSPIQVFAGQMLAMKSMLRSAPEDRPVQLDLVEAAIDTCLMSMLGELGVKLDGT